MIIPDVNLLIYAYDESSVHHERALNWWEAVVNGGSAVGLAWSVSLGFIRLTTNRRVFANPLRIDAAFAAVKSWVARPNVTMIHPGMDHLRIVERLLHEAGVAAELVTDAHIAALAMEYQAELHSNDSDFGRFKGLKWVNPLR